MKKVLKALGILFSILTGLFIVTFTMYFFNLDMKMTAMLEPFMIKHYNKIERNSHL